MGNKKTYLKSWTLDTWSGHLDSGHLDSGRLDSGSLDAWTLDTLTLYDLTLGLWMRGLWTIERLDSERMYPESLNVLTYDWSLKLRIFDVWALKKLLGMSSISYSIFFKTMLVLTVVSQPHLIVTSGQVFFGIFTTTIERYQENFHPENSHPSNSPLENSHPEYSHPENSHLEYCHPCF